MGLNLIERISMIVVIIIFANVIGIELFESVPEVPVRPPGWIDPDTYTPGKLSKRVVVDNIYAGDNISIIPTVRSTPTK